jgi:hypothetical protein
MPGMLLHIDGSKHQWFGNERWHDLIVILDDATSEIFYAQLVEEESTDGDGGAAGGDPEERIILCSLQRPRESFFVTSKAGEKWTSTG